MAEETKQTAPTAGQEKRDTPNRDARLAEALRANLHRRKAQARARKPASGADAP